jgi:hypothetical protein
MDQKKKAKLMELFSEALEKKAYVNIHFTQYETNDFKPVFKNDVEEKAKELAGMLSVNVKETTSDSFNIATDSIHLCFSYLPPAAEYMEEDVWIDESKLG